MVSHVPLWLWAAAFGAVGGAANALLKRERALLWALTKGRASPRRRLAELGVLGNALAGAVGAATLCVAAYSLGGDTASVAGWRMSAMACVLGWASSRLITDHLEKRLLQAAACAAAAAPAAPQETVAELADAAPRAAYEIADRLMPRTQRRV